MRIIGWIVYLTLLTISVVAQESKSYTFMTYNVRNCKGMDNVVDFDRIASVINKENPDFVALQELDSLTQRSNGAIVIEEIAKRTKMYYYYSPSIDFQGGAYGVGILSKQKGVSMIKAPLPGREEARSVMVVDYGSFLFGSTHLSLNAEDRVLSSQKIKSLFAQEERPVILAGDLNDTHLSESIKSLSEEFVFVSDVLEPTIPVVNPTRCIDYILGYMGKGQRYKMIKTKVIQETMASDHLPVVSEVSITFKPE